MEVGGACLLAPNETDFKGRKTKNIIRVRAVFADLDGADPENINRVPLELSWRTRTSLTRYHAYWKAENIGLAEFTKLQKAVAAKVRGDPQVCDLPRVMRLPGFLYQKHQPFLVKGEAINSGNIINSRGKVMALLDGAADAILGVKGPRPNVSSWPVTKPRLG
jgi:hypothetical protein